MARIDSRNKLQCCLHLRSLLHLGSLLLPRGQHGQQRGMRQHRLLCLQLLCLQKGLQQRRARLWSGRCMHLASGRCAQQ